MKDWRGIEITVGSTVLYGVSKGSHGVDLIVGEVIGFRPKEEAKEPRYADDKVRVRWVAQNRGYQGTREERLILPELATVVHLPNEVCPTHGFFSTEPVGDRNQRSVTTCLANDCDWAALRPCP